MTPEQLAILRDAIRQGPEGSIPYQHAAAVISFLILVMGALAKWGLSKDAALVASQKERLEEQKAVAVTLDRATEALREARRAA